MKTFDILKILANKYPVIFFDLSPKLNKIFKKWNKNNYNIKNNSKTISQQDDDIFEFI